MSDTVAQSPVPSSLQPINEVPHTTPISSGNTENSPKTSVANTSAMKETPPAVRQRRAMATALHCSSPSDSMLSPCTSKLFGKKSKISSASAILRSKQQAAIPLNLSQSEDEDKMDSDK
ncbi:hypothetical protein PFISCL1PPCAC_15403 [Pristionchus fissidentatus]|uniref:Uncharacterized protein n=1 Tax=Pristionchus fissidentatus TaxID=1538716 RepID=A0AAV5VWF0_9BILA|nr:hypothetical protein PFISCL1PPCAC_15403 [Pristionchus fissidentatus]